MMHLEFTYLIFMQLKVWLSMKALLMSTQRLTSPTTLMLLSHMTLAKMVRQLSMLWSVFIHYLFWPMELKAG